MTEPVSREQVAIVTNMTLDEFYAHAKARESKDPFAHDAARLMEAYRLVTAAREQDRQRYRELEANYAKVVTAKTLVPRDYAELKQEIQALKQERDEARLEKSGLETDLSVERINIDTLQQQLATAQARVDECEKTILPAFETTLNETIDKLEKAQARCAEVEQERDDWKAAQQAAKREYLDMADEWDKARAELSTLTTALQQAKGALERYRTAIDNIYNHNAAARAAVIMHFGIHHDQAALAAGPGDHLPDASKMVWTSEKPKVPGWYWWNRDNAMVVEVRQGPHGLMMGYPEWDDESIHWLYLSDTCCAGQWCGPIPLPPDGQGA